MVVPAASAASTRFSFGLARYAASLHVVLGHLHARNLSGGAYICCWGYTWVPWFFMLSGFILCAAEIKNPRQESFVDYVARRLVTIYPVYAFGLLVACCLANLNAPSAWVLVLQAWLLQAWLPLITEWGLQMQCWFLSCLVVYWALFPWLFRTVSKLTLHQVLFAMLMAIMVPVLYLVVPDLFYGNATWYEYHEWGHMRNSTDALVVMLKFHPVCYFHVFLFGMLLARFRVILSEFEFKNQPEYQKVLGVVMELLAPLGYAGLMLVFNVPVASPPFAKLSARIFALLPLQAAVVMGLAGLEGQAQPRLARCFSPFNFLESYSYCLYVMQFICMKVWIGKDFGLAFFVFLIASAALVQILVQKPAETLWKVSPTKASWRIPAALCVVVLGIWMFTRWQASEVALPELVQRDGYLDRRLPLRVEGDDEGAIINPSITLLGDELVLAARLHRRSSRLTHDQRGAVLEEIWHSKILLGSLTLSAESWQRFHGGGHIPGDSIYLRPWEGLG
ncbi:unnamed protein product [Effrenium voratum]|uniref:Acyltransferase 3 domain-containing protein n=1 Tax=Effrenium voratum TaxID=2562239 RepID=A0AA36HST1_9DINO|nr:unnamed protein product [Effrenium voratum]